MKKSTFWIILPLLASALYAGWKRYFGCQQPHPLVIDQPQIPVVVEEPRGSFFGAETDDSQGSGECRQTQG